jgi:uncharacterized membrane protein YoaK (UPF0700 family)
MQSLDRQRQALAFSLAGLAGFVDAVGFLAADAYFVSFMSGNTTRLGVDLVQDWSAAARPALLILGFVCGVASGSLVAAKAGMWRKPAVLSLVTAWLLHAAILPPDEGRGALLALLVLAMGALNNTFRRDGEVVVGLTYMTGALVRLGQAMAAPLTGETRSDWRPYLLLWTSLAAGAVAGGLVVSHLPALSLWLPALWAGSHALIAARMVRRETG